MSRCTHVYLTAHFLLFACWQGKQAKALMNAGKLVGDDVVVGIVGDALKNPACAKGFILDGFPRTGCEAFPVQKEFFILKAHSHRLFSTVPQAKMLDELLAKDKVAIDKVF